MQELFRLTETNRNVRNKYKLNLYIPVVNQVTYVLKAFRPKLWSSPQHHVKSAKNFEILKNIINS